VARHAGRGRFTETGGPGSDVLQRDTADQRLPVFADDSVDHQTTAKVDGLDIRATGYGEPFAYRPEDRPAMAVDGDPETAWVVADRFNPIGQRLEVRGDVAGMSLLQSQQLGASRMITAVHIDYDTGPSQDVQLDDSSLAGAGQPVDVPGGAQRAAITITAVGPRPGQPIPVRRQWASPNWVSARTRRSSRCRPTRRRWQPTHPSRWC
jgi:arabinofuranan 3-O-arabinosyltransferase